MAEPADARHVIDLTRFQNDGVSPAVMKRVIDHLRGDSRLPPDVRIKMRNKETGGEIYHDLFRPDEAPQGVGAAINRNPLARGLARAANQLTLGGLDAAGDKLADWTLKRPEGVDEADDDAALKIARDVFKDYARGTAAGATGDIGGLIAGAGKLTQIGRAAIPKIAPGVAQKYAALAAKYPKAALGFAGAPVAAILGASDANIRRGYNEPALPAIAGGGGVGGVAGLLLPPAFKAVGQGVGRAVESGVAEKIAQNLPVGALAKRISELWQPDRRFARRAGNIASALDDAGVDRKQAAEELARVEGVPTSDIGPIGGGPALMNLYQRLKSGFPGDRPTPLPGRKMTDDGVVSGEELAKSFAVLSKIDRKANLRARDSLNKRQNELIDEARPAEFETSGVAKMGAALQKTGEQIGEKQKNAWSAIRDIEKNNPLVKQDMMDVERAIRQSGLADAREAQEILIPLRAFNEAAQSGRATLRQALDVHDRLTDILEKPGHHTQIKQVMGAARDDVRKRLDVIFKTAGAPSDDAFSNAMAISGSGHKAFDKGTGKELQNLIGRVNKGEILPEDAADKLLTKLPADKTHKQMLAAVDEEFSGDLAGGFNRLWQDVKLRAGLEGLGQGVAGRAALKKMSEEAAALGDDKLAGKIGNIRAYMDWAERVKNHPALLEVPEAKMNFLEALLVRTGGASVGTGLSKGARGPGAGPSLVAASLGASQFMNMMRKFIGTTGAFADELMSDKKLLEAVLKFEGQNPGLVMRELVKLKDASPERLFHLTMLMMGLWRNLGDDGDEGDDG